MGELMGKLGKAIGPLTNQKLTDPNTGQTTFGNEQQTLDRLNAMPMPGSNAAIGLPNQQMPTLSQPSYQQALSMGSPTGMPNAASPGLTKAGKLVTMLTQGLQGALAGRAAQEQTIAQTGGRRAGGVGMGFEAGFQLPWQRAMQQQELQKAQAQTELIKAQGQMVEVPGYGPVPVGLAKVLFPASIRASSVENAATTRAGATTEAAKTRAGASVQAAQIAAKGKIDAERMKQMIANGQVAHILPAQGEDGSIVQRAYNKRGDPIGDLDGALPPGSYLPKSTSTVEYKQLDDGSIVSLPKTTTAAPILPGNPKGAGVSRGTSMAGPVASGPIADAQGNPLVGKGAITNTTRTMVETAPKVEDLVKRIRGQISDLQNSGALGPAASRWNEFWSGKVGADNPKFRALQTNTTLLSTLLMRMHMGARGGQQIMEHFDNMIGAGHQSAANMLATMDQIESYANEVKGATQLPSSYGKGNQPKGGAAVTHVYNPKTGQLEAR